MLSTNTQQKIDRIAEIKSSIIKLEEELETIFNTANTPASAPVPAKPPKPAKEPKPRKVDESDTRPALCDECGTKGKRHFKTCSKSGKAAPASEETGEAQEPNPDRSVPSSGRIRDLIKSGFNDEWIAGEVNCKIRTVAFIRKQMIGRGEAKA